MTTPLCQGGQGRTDVSITETGYVFWLLMAVAVVGSIVLILVGEWR